MQCSIYDALVVVCVHLPPIQAIVFSCIVSQQYYLIIQFVTTNLLYMQFICHIMFATALCCGCLAIKIVTCTPAA